MKNLKTCQNPSCQEQLEQALTMVSRLIDRLYETTETLEKMKKEKSAMPKHFIKKAISNPGSLHKELGIKPGEKIPQKTLEKAEKAGGKLGQRARLAETLEKMGKKK